ncbi:uncharacterized protein LOC121738765 [Aricia agestis]|uniref:uncharacterized protein LOC121738765 n=1 Tax=Aricia agestis TaxID=91739 RepID=UPI001C207CF9|nr:uncharacterized protein LOC121738765 [Aricia agestis]
MAAFVIILVATCLFCMAHSQFLPPIVTRDYGYEYGPLTSSITVVDNSMSLALANALQSMILTNFLDSSINLSPKYNPEYPYSFVVESVTYSPIIDTFFPCDTPVYDIYPVSYTDISPVYLPEPQVIYTETIYGPPLPMASDKCFADVMAPNLQIVPISCVGGYDIVPVNAVPSNFGLVDIIMPPYGGFNDFYMSGVPLFFDNL